MSPTDLSPAEALVLLDPAFDDGRKALKISLRWLIAHGLLKASCEAKPGTWFFRVRPRLQLSDPSWEERALAEELAEILDAARSARTDFFEDILPILQWNSGASPYLPMGRRVQKRLASRHLLAQETDRGPLGIGPETYVRTPVGNALCERLTALLGPAGQIPRIIATEPRRAAALAAPLGGLLLILTELRPEWGALSELLASAAREVPSGALQFDLSKLDGAILDAIDALIDSD